MSLYRQLVAVVLGVFIVLALGSVITGVKQSRDSVQEQLQGQANDLASSLAFSISASEAQGNHAMQQLAIEQVFASESLRSIAFRDAEGEPIVSRVRVLNEADVPRWFLRTLSLSAPSAQRRVIVDGKLVGVVDLQLDTDAVVYSLWKIIHGQLLLLSLICCICLLLVGPVLNNALRPLKRIERQVDAVSRREFNVQGQLPRERELRSLAMTLNRMVFKVRAMFQEQLEIAEGLHRQAHIDDVTGLSNRRDFDARFEAFLNSESAGGAGALFLLQLSDFHKFNKAFGRSSGDACLQQVADHFMELLAGFAGMAVSRRAGTDFAAFLPGLSVNEIRALAEQLYQRVAASGDLQKCREVGVHLGVAYSPVVTLQSRLLPEADATLAKAQQMSANGWQVRVLEEQEELVVRDATQWRLFLERALNEKDVMMHFQPVRKRVDKSLMHLEVLCRIQDSDQLLSAGEFWPWIERHQLQSDFDRLMLEMIRETGLQYANELKFSINISTYSVQDIAFIDWLVGFLKENPNFSRRLVLEFSELVVQRTDHSIGLLFDQLRELGVTLCMSGFGAGGASFSYLNSLPISYLKVAAETVRGIDDSKDNQFFVKSLLQISRECDIQMLAEGVETELELHQLSLIGVDGVQGYCLDKPSPVVLQQ
ncbi:MAG: EAL domain-containing protein [Cellvibrionaceae bacterium]